MDNTRGLVSLIIPVYNVSEFLPQALESISRQTYRDLEIILVDDGSTDGSGDMCDEFAKNDGRAVVIHQPNGGISAARNRGLDIMKGEILAFFDPDDVLEPDYVSSMMAAMKEDGPDIVVSRYNNLGHLVSKKPMPDAAPGTYSRDEALRFLALGDLNIHMWNKLFRRELFSGIRFPVGHNYEDADTIFRVLDACRSVEMIDPVLYLYRYNPKSVTTTYTWKNINDRILAFSHFEKYISDNIPQIFSQDHLTYRRRKTLSALVSNFSRTYRIRTSEKEEQDRVRDYIVRSGAGGRIRICRPNTRAGYWIIRLCPPLLRVIYTVYRPFSILYSAVKG